MGFPLDHVNAALFATGGNEEAAVNSLLTSPALHNGSVGGARVESAINSATSAAQLSPSRVFPSRIGTNDVGGANAVISPPLAQSSPGYNSNAPFSNGQQQQQQSQQQQQQQQQQQRLTASGEPRPALNSVSAAELHATVQITHFDKSFTHYEFAVKIVSFHLQFPAFLYYRY